MSIASTMLAMGYVPSTESANNCGACARSYQAETNDTAAARSYVRGLRCTDGAFFTVRRATCRHFEPRTTAPAAAPGRIQIGPTDI